MLLLARTRGLRRKQFSICSKHIICLHCYYECSECSPLALTHAVKMVRSPRRQHILDHLTPENTPGENSIIPQQRWTVMWSETVGLRTRPVWDQKKSVLVLVFHVVVLVLQVWCCVLKHNLVTVVVIMILKDTATFQVLFSFSILSLGHRYCGDQQWRSVHLLKS